MADTIGPVTDDYIDSIINANDPYNPNLNKTQGVQLRALVKLLRDRLEQEIANLAASPSLPPGGTAGQVLTKLSDTGNLAWVDRFIYDGFSFNYTVPANSGVGFHIVYFQFNDPAYPYVDHPVQYVDTYLAAGSPVKETDENYYVSINPYPLPTGNTMYAGSTIYFYIYHNFNFKGALPKGIAHFSLGLWNDNPLPIMLSSMVANANAGAYDDASITNKFFYIGLSNESSTYVPTTEEQGYIDTLTAKGWQFIINNSSFPA